MQALVIIDLQNGIKHPKLGARNNPQAEDNVALLLAAWRAANAPVIHVRHMSRSPESVFWPGQDGAAFQPRFAPLGHEHVLEKNVPDAFANSGFERWLHARGLSELVIVGVATNNSVESTARTAGNLGLKALVVSDATFTFGLRDYAGTLRGADEVHAMALANLALDYAAIATTKDVLATLAAQSM